MSNVHLAKHHGVLLGTLFKISKAHFLLVIMSLEWRGNAGGRNLTINGIWKFLYVDPHIVAREHGFLAFENLENQGSYLFWPWFLCWESDLR